MIAETEEVDFFKKAEAQINENAKITSIINQIKALQKQAVNFKHYEKHEALKQTEAKIDALQAELDEIPIIQEFRDSQMEVNDLLQLVAHTISNKVTNEIITSTGGRPADRRDRFKTQKFITELFIIIRRLSRRRFFI